MNLGLNLGLGSVRPAGGFSPLALFAAGEQGYWLDPSDFSTLFQDEAGTIPVTTTGQSVRRILDKSGRGNHFTQANVANAPTLQVDGNGKFFLLFDGTDDGMASAATINPGAVDKVQVFAGLRKLSDAALGMLLETSANAGANPGSFYFAAPETTGASGNYTWYASGGGGPTALASGTFLAPETAVLTATADIAGDSRVLRRNGVQVGTSAADLGAGNFLTYTHFLGRRNNASLPSNVRVYQMIARYGGNLDAGRIAEVEASVNQRTAAF